MKEITLLVKIKGPFFYAGPQETASLAYMLEPAVGALQEALAALREAQQPDTAAMFIRACREIYAEIISDLGDLDDKSSSW